MDGFTEVLGGILVAVITFFGVVLTNRSSRQINAENQRAEAARTEREQMREEHRLAIGEVRKNQADLVDALGRERTERRRINRLLALAIDDLREYRAILRLHNFPARPIHQELSEVWFEFSQTTEGNPNEQQ